MRATLSLAIIDLPVSKGLYKHTKAALNGATGALLLSNLPSQELTNVFEISFEWHKTCNQSCET